MTPSSTEPDSGPLGDSRIRTLISRVSRLEMVVGAVIAVAMLVLVVIEPEILEAPFENERTILFTVGGTALAALAFVAMLWFKVPAIVRVVVLVVPFLIVNWWLISPYFIDDVVDESFETSISAQLADPEAAPAASEITVEAPASAEQVEVDAEAPVVPPAVEEAPVVEEAPASDEAPVVDEQQPVEEEPAPPAPTGPVLLGAGQFTGLAGHAGSGDAGVFQNPDGSLVLRFENFETDNGPDLEVYLVPGADQTSLPEGSIHLGALKGNIGDQNYELPAGTELAPGTTYTALVWCEAFSVEFTGATFTV